MKRIGDWIIPLRANVTLVTTADKSCRPGANSVKSRHPLKMMGERAASFAQKSDAEKKQFILTNIPEILLKRLSDTLVTEALQ